MTSEANSQRIEDLYNKAEELRDQVAKHIFREPDTELLEKLKAFSKNFTQEIDQTILEILEDEQVELEELKWITANLVVLLRLFQQSQGESQQQANSLQKLGSWLENDVIDLLLNPILVGTIRTQSGGQGNTPPPPPKADADASGAVPFLGMGSNLVESAGQGNTPRNPRPKQ
jgi:hypothetical protein